MTICARMILRAEELILALSVVAGAPRQEPGGSIPLVIHNSGRSPPHRHGSFPFGGVAISKRCPVAVFPEVRRTESLTASLVGSG